MLLTLMLWGPATPLSSISAATSRGFEGKAAYAEDSLEANTAVLLGAACGLMLCIRLA
jgi:hypothetical protein